MTTETMLMKRLSIFVYGVVCYTASLATLL